MTVVANLGQHIRKAREQAQVSQAELARRIGISANALCSIETGETDPRVSRVVAIARELNLPIRYAGIGEQKDDLIPFDPKHYVDSLFD